MRSCLQNSLSLERWERLRSSSFYATRATHSKVRLLAQRFFELQAVGFQEVADLAVGSGRMRSLGQVRIL